jgi:hypothetical protein
MTPTARTIAYFFDRGIIAGSIESRQGPITVDWPGKGVGFADILVADPDGPLLIQVTSRSNHASRRTKMLNGSAHAIRSCLRCGLRVELWSWAPDDDQPRVEAVTEADLDQQLAKLWTEAGRAVTEADLA